MVVQNISSVRWRWCYEEKERRKERWGVHGAPVLLCSSSSLISLLKAAVFSDLTWLMIPPAWLILSGLDDSLEKKEEGGLIYRWQH